MTNENILYRSGSSTWMERKFKSGVVGDICIIMANSPDGSDGKESAYNTGDFWIGKIPWRREWQPTPVFLPGEFHGQRSLGGYSPWGQKASEATEQLTTHGWFILLYNRNYHNIVKRLYSNKNEFFLKKGRSSKYRSRKREIKKYYTTVLPRTEQQSLLSMERVHKTC